jgi:hypothetical protein
MAGIWFFLKETREKRQIIEIDYAGILTLIVAILSFLTIFLLGGREFDWASAPILGLSALFVVSAVGFYAAEKRSNEPILCFDFSVCEAFPAAMVWFFSAVWPSLRSPPSVHCLSRAPWASRHSSWALS